MRPLLPLSVPYRGIVVAKVAGSQHWTNTKLGHQPSKTRIGPDHEVKAGASAHGKKLRNRQLRRRTRRWNKDALR